MKEKQHVSFKAACQIAGILSESNQNVIDGLGSFGMHLGNAFQIIDDTLDYESDSLVMGKEVGDDLSEGKVTLPMIYALENTKGSEKETLSQCHNEC